VPNAYIFVWFGEITRHYGCNEGLASLVKVYF